MENKEEVKLTPKQAKFLKYYFESGNGVQSALKAYDTKDYQTASVISAQNLAKLRPSIKTMMEMRGLTVYKLIDTLNGGLEANKVISAYVTDKEANSRTNDFIEVPDHQARLKAVEIAGKWLGAEQQQPTNQTNIQINATDFFKEDK